MSSSELTEKLQGDGCYKTNDCTVDVHSGDSHKVDAVHSENTKDMTEEYNHADNLLPSSPAVEESEKMVATEVLIEDKLDRGYSWVIVCASFVNCFIVGTMFIGFSILYVEITEFCGSSKGVAGGIGSLYMASGNTFGVFFSIFIGRYGCRIVTLVGSVVWFIGFGVSAVAPNVVVLYFSYGIVAGMGFNMVTLSSFVIVQQHFKKFRALAAAISASGISIGTLCAGPLLTAMLNAFQWRGTLLLMSSMVLNGCVFGSFYRPPQPPRGSAGRQKTTSLDAACGKTSHSDATLRGSLLQMTKDLTNLSLFSNVPFTLVCFGSLLMNFGLMVFIQHTPSRAVFIGIARELAYLLPTVTGAALLSGRIIGGVIGNLPCTNRLLQYGTNIIAGGVLLIILGYLLHFVALAAFGAAIGFVTGCFLTIQTTVLSDLVGVKNIARAQAFQLLFLGVGALISIPLAGFIVDKTENYDIPFYMGGIVQVLGGSLIIIAVILKHVMV